MITSNRALIVASLLAAGCSAGEETPAPGLDPVTNPSSSMSVTPVGSNSQAPIPTGTGPVASNAPSSTATPQASGSVPVDPPLPPAGKCMPGIPVTSQIARMSMIQYDGAIRDLLNVTVLASGKSPAVGLGFDEDQGNMTSTEWTAHQKVAAEIAASVMASADKTKFISCDPATAGCLDTTIRTFGKKAFRRPLEEAEVAQFMKFDNLTPKGEPAAVAEAILYAFLVSPSFIMLPELSDTVDTVSGAYTLSPYETATRLATLIWRSIPDDALLLAAENGELNDKAQIFAQAQRMIAVTEKSGPLLADFHRFYADIRPGSHWNNTLHAESKLPANVTQDAVNKAMMSEVGSFFSEVAGSGTYKDLFLSPVAYVNKYTAEIYGLDASQYGEEMERVMLDPAQRPGFLTRIGFLSSYSNYEETSPILRGAYIAANQLGVSPGAPQDGVPTDPPAGVNYMSKREKVEALTSPPDCAFCHATKINPPGFVMEMFDTVGRIQTKDALGGDINMSANVMIDGATVAINNPKELMDKIATGAGGQRLYAERWVTYATGRSPNGNDACSVDTISMKLLADGSYTIVNLLADLSQTEPFTLRNVGAAN